MGVDYSVLDVVVTVKEDITRVLGFIGFGQHVGADKFGVIMMKPDRGLP